MWTRGEINAQPLTQSYIHATLYRYAKSITLCTHSPEILEKKNVFCMGSEYIFYQYSQMPVIAQTNDSRWRVALSSSSLKEDEELVKEKYKKTR